MGLLHQVYFFRERKPLHGGQGFKVSTSNQRLLPAFRCYGTTVKWALQEHVAYTEAVENGTAVAAWVAALERGKDVPLSGESWPACILVQAYGLVASS